MTITPMTDAEAMDVFIRKDIVERDFGSLRGLTVVNVRAMSRSECEAHGWNYDNPKTRIPFIITFHDGTTIVPVCDREADDSGWLLVADSWGVS